MIDRFGRRAGDDSRRDSRESAAIEEPVVAQPDMAFKRTVVCVIIVLMASGAEFGVEVDQ